MPFLAIYFFFLPLSPRESLSLPLYRGFGPLSLILIPYAALLGIMLESVCTLYVKDWKWLKENQTNTQTIYSIQFCQLNWRITNLFGELGQAHQRD